MAKRRQQRNGQPPKAAGGINPQVRDAIREPHRGDFFEFMGEMIRLPVDVVTAYPDDEAEEGTRR